MNAIRRYLKPVGYLLIIAMVGLSLPHAPARAAMVSTDRILDEAVAGDLNRDRIRDFLRREEVQAQIRTQGVDPVEAAARVDALSDWEVRQIARKLDELPAGALGGDEIFFGGSFILILGFLIFVVYAGVVFLFINIMESD